MVVPFVTCPWAFSLLGVEPARGRRRWDGVPLENSLSKGVFGLRSVVVSLLSSFYSEIAPLFSGSQKEKNRPEHRAND